MKWRSWLLGPLAILPAVACNGILRNKGRPDSGGAWDSGAIRGDGGSDKRVSVGGGGAAGAGEVGADGSGGSLDTSPGAFGGVAVPPPCTRRDVFVEALPVDAYIVFGRSSSMATTYPGSNPPMTWWAVARLAMSSFVNNAGAAGRGVGIQYFPVDGGDAQSCAGSLYETPDVPIGLLPGNGAALTASMQSHVPGGSPPTEPALTGAIDYMKTWASNHPGRQPVVVLVTDTRIQRKGTKRRSPVTCPPWIPS